LAVFSPPERVGKGLSNRVGDDFYRMRLGL
jgi:hypothetical protein